MVLTTGDVRDSISGTVVGGSEPEPGVPVVVANLHPVLSRAHPRVNTGDDYVGRWATVGEPDSINRTPGSSTWGKVANVVVPGPAVAEGVATGGENDTFFMFGIFAPIGIGFRLDAVVVAGAFPCFRLER